MSTIQIDVTGLSGVASVQLPEGATAADLREAQGINDGVQLRADGEALSDDAPLRDNQTVVTAAPAAKHG